MLRIDPGFLISVVALVGLAGAAPRSVRAFSASAVYDGAPSVGGGGGRWFTGSPAEGMTCSACHSEGPGQVSYPFYVQGVPAVEGYVAGMTYAMSITWPQFEQRWRALRPDPMVAPGPGSPAVGLLAELVAEDGLGGGMIEIDSLGAAPAAYCEKPRPNTKDRLGAALYQVRPGIDAVEIPPDEDGVLRCQARQLGQRCLIALTSCGAHRVDFRWTPPSEASGAIWFSAGMVASESLNGSPDLDSVYELSRPILDASGAADGYEETLEGAPCSVAAVGASGAGRGSTAPGFLAGLGALLLGLRTARRQRKQRQHRRGPWLAKPALMAALALTSGCMASDPEIDQSRYPAAGLFTPGSTLGASDPDDVMPPLGAVGDRCEEPDSGDDDSVYTGGTFTLEYKTQTLMAQYAPDNYTAVWIENAAGEFVDALEETNGLRVSGLRCYQMRACQDNEKVMDVISSATWEGHDEPHEGITWDGNDFTGEPMPDGEYSLYIEVTETDKADGDCVEYRFVKGPDGFVQQLDVAFDGGLERASITWEPEPPGEDE